MKISEIKKIFSDFENLKVGVFGDFALDIYYNLIQNTGENSIETGKPVLYGSSIKTNLAAAGNIVNNLISLGIKNVFAFGFIGNDILGREILFQLKEKNVNIDSILSINNIWETFTYIKPLENKEEISRIDFGSLNFPEKDYTDILINKLSKKIHELDVLIVNQQFKNPLVNDYIFTKLNEIIKENTQCKIIGDLRNDLFPLENSILKVTSFLISKELGEENFDENDTDTAIFKLRKLFKKIKTPLLMIRGESGLIYFDDKNIETVPGIYLTGEIDKLGSGNACVSTFAACLGSGASINKSLEIANLAFAIIAKQIKKIGSVTQVEILKLAEESYYNYDLALAYDPRKAKYFENSEIEIVGELPQNISIQNVILDHDGTISTLREGWETVMHKVMIEEICGDKLQEISSNEYNRLSVKCDKFINDTTGIQTIIQMMGLQDIILEEGFIQKEKVKTPAEYKAIYLDNLMFSVNDRIKKFENGERSIHDFTILGSVEMLKKIHEKNLKLFLASGTDEDSVVTEANALGYGNLFSGGIRGSKGNEIGDAKKIVINRIIEEGNCKGENLMVIGDGPVEIIEGRKVGSLCIGIASDEVRRHGMNYKKRTRLIRAGAHIIIPDFSQLNYLLKIIFKN
ncbi:MAG: HAD hydrolase-like protein [Ignavibacteriae bacterium]|nr:HAD hydrolase-like protein [Ignavibacteriota bacterium]